MRTIIEHDVDVPMRDGTVLRADVYRPAGPGPYPVLVARTPYGKTEMTELQYLDPWLAARSGLIAVIQDVRGRGMSGGEEWVPLAAEALDGTDTVTWAAGLPGSNGAVGMWGPSYLGNVQWQAAGQQPAALKAIVPQFTFATADDGLVTRGGARELALVRSWAVGAGFDAVLRRHGADEDGMVRQLRELVQASDGFPGGSYEELPTEPDPLINRLRLPHLGAPGSLSAAEVRLHQARAVVPSLHVGGWFDCFLQGTLDNYQAAAASGHAQLVVGPWNHLSQLAQQGEVNFGFAGNGFAVDYGPSIAGLSFEWLRPWLTGEQPPSEQPRRVRLFVMGANEWRDEDEWPLVRAVETGWYLHDGGGLSVESPPSVRRVGYTYDPSNPVPTLGGNTLASGFPAGVFDQRLVEGRPDVLTFTSAPLDDDLEVTGRITADLTISTDAPTTDWVVRLCDVHPDGRSFNVVDGISRARLEPGDWAPVRVDLWSTSMLFKRGHRLRVQVTSSCFPRWDRNLNTDDGAATGRMRPARQQVALGGVTGSRINLPVVRQ